MDNHKKIWNEIAEEAPLLAGLKRDNRLVFLVPEGYFEALPDAVSRRLEAGLDAEAGRTSMRAPEGYFEELTDRIMDAVENADAVDARVVQLHEHRRREAIPIRRWATVAAAVALFLVMGILTARFVSSSVTEEPQVAISNDDALEYMQENIDGFESEDLMLLVADRGGALGAATPNLEDAVDEYLEEYIDEIDEQFLVHEI